MAINNPFWNNSSSDPGAFNVIGNWLTGNLDYQRQIESAQRAEAHSALEAQKARDFNALEAQKARDFSAIEAKKNREFQRDMSNSAYSRAVADLKRAGINPYAIGMASPASVPSGSTASAYQASGSGGASFVGSANKSNVLGELVGILSTALKLSKIVV